jgi:hypothetical protein
MNIAEVASRENRRKDAQNEINLRGRTNIVDRIFVKDGDLIVALFKKDELLLKSELEGMFIQDLLLVFKEDSFDWSNNPILITNHFDYPEHEIRISLPTRGRAVLHLSNKNENDAKIVNDWFYAISKKTMESN